MIYLNDTVERRLILYKSSNHTYDELVQTLWIGCGYEEVQCEQLATLIQTKGKGCIKIGYMDELGPIGETIELDGFQIGIE